MVSSMGRWHSVRRLIGGFAVAGGVVACGGGELLAILQIVTPLNGLWADGPDDSIQFLTPDVNTQLFSSKLQVTATVRSASGMCGDALGNGVDVVGTLDNGAVVLRPVNPANAANCIDGTFTDLRRLAVVAIGAQPARSYLNSRVDVQMDVGLWVSESGTLTLKFDGPASVDNFTGANAEFVSGCNVSNLNAKVNFEGEMRGFEVATLKRPLIPELFNPLNNIEKYFTQVEFVDGATVTLRNVLGQSVMLKRQPNPNNVAC